MEEPVGPYQAQVHAWLRRPCASARFRVHSRLFAFALAVRLSLPDAFGGDWLGLSLLGWLAVALLAVNGNLLGWILTGVVAVGGIFFLSDQLSQSVFLLGTTAIAIACWVGPATTRSRRLEVAMPAAIRWLTVSVYAFAALHKLNVDFFKPEYSCANAGVDRLLAGSALSSSVSTWAGWPVVFVACELLLALGFVLRPRLAVVVAPWFHLPLTIIFAPAFAFTMATGWICFLEDQELAVIRKIGRKYAIRIGSAAAVMFSCRMYLFFPGRWATDPDWCVKELLLFVVAVWLTAFALLQGRTYLLQRKLASQTTAPRPWLGPVVAAVYAANALTPYLGLQFHHTGAMLSNLRVDAGCYNSIVFPESLRIQDPYVRIDRVVFAPYRSDPAYTLWVRERLWSLRALWNERRRWCRIHPEKLRVTLRYRGKGYSVENFCDPSGWPLEQPRLPYFRAFQVNLRRTCPQPCLH